MALSGRTPHGGAGGTLPPGPGGRQRSGTTRTAARLHAADGGVVVGVVEEDDGIPGPLHVRIGQRNAVFRRPVDAVGPARQQVGHVDGHRAGDRRDGQPPAVHQGFQSFHPVMEDQRDGAVIGMRSRPQLAGPGPALHRRVVEQTHGAGVGRMLVRKEVLGCPQGQRHGPHQRRTGPGAGLVEVHDRLTEAVHGDAPVVEEFDTGLVHAEGLLEVPGLFGIETLHGHARVARDDVPVGPPDGFLDLSRQREELPGLGGDPFPQARGQRQVGEVEEPELAAGCADPVRHAAPGLGVAAQEGSEIDRGYACHHPVSVSRAAPASITSLSSLSLKTTSRS